MLFLALKKVQMVTPKYTPKTYQWLKSKYVKCKKELQLSPRSAAA